LWCKIVYAPRKNAKQSQSPVFLPCWLRLSYHPYKVAVFALQFSEENKYYTTLAASFATTLTEIVMNTRKKDSSAIGSAKPNAFCPSLGPGTALIAGIGL
jgi:hypothetical protein